MTRARSTWTLVLLCAAMSVTIISVTSLYVATAGIARDTGATQSDIAWILDAYTLVLAALLLPAGALGDRFGRRRILIVGLVVFSAAAAAVQLVDTPGQLIADRAVLGAGAALILPSTLSLITSTFPPEVRERSVAIWSAMFAAAGAGGGAFSAILLSFFSWRSAFWLALVGALLVLLAARTLPESRDEDAPPMDLPGSALSVLSMTLLVFGLIEGGSHGWGSPLIVVAIAAGIAGFAAFAVMQRRRAAPLLDVALFADRTFAAAVFAIVLAFAAVFGVAFLVIPYGQLVEGTTPLLACLPMAAMTITTLPATFAAPRLVDRFGLGAVLAAGTVFEAVGFVVMLGTDVGMSPVVFYAATLAVGVGLGFVGGPGTTAIMDGVPVAKQGVAASINHTAREFGTAVGVALFGGLLTAGYDARVTAATDGMPAAAQDAARASIAGAMQVAGALGPAGAPLAAAAREAYAGAERYTSAVMIGVLACGALATALWVPRRRRPDRVQQALSGLAQRDQALLALSYGRELPDTRIAAALCRTPDDIATMRLDALERLAASAGCSRREAIAALYLA